MSVHVFDSMGTTVSLRFAGGLPAAATLTEVEDVFARLDRRFSLYRPDSELSRVARGEVLLPAASAHLRDTHGDALEWSRVTAGAFTPYRPDGVLDLSGLVKAEAIAAAGRVLDRAGEACWLVNAGGDLLRRGSLPGGGWRIGIVDPDDRTALLCTLALSGSRRAVATSGTAERGEHIWRGPSSTEASSYRQVTVLANDIVTADVLATALLAGGPAQTQEILGGFDLDILTVDGTGTVTATPRLQRAAGLLPA